MKVGTIPLYRGRDGLRVCLVSTTASRKRFTFPKGVVRGREAWQKGALRELSEEAGLEGRVLLPRQPLVLAGRERPSDGIVLYWCEVLSVADAWAEDGARRRMFCPADRLPEVRLGRTGREVFRELLKLDLGGGPGAEAAEAGILARLRARLLGLPPRADIDAAAGR